MAKACKFCVFLNSYVCDNQDCIDCGQCKKTGGNGMTTVAWDGRMMAADRQLTLGGTAIPLKKIFKYGNDLVGCCGSVQESMLFLEWYCNGRDPDRRPKLEEGFSAMVVTGGQCRRFENLLMPYPIDMPYWAAGSGADYALGAMAAGKNAKEAVEIAIRFDTGSGLGIDVLNFEGE